jgi:acetylornithine deacetylase/succinyl-diaminopimelate desuccinylase-like protein
MTRQAALAYAQAARSAALDDLCALLAIPSVSTLPEHAPDLARAAQWCADYLGRIGLEDVQILPMGGAPLVYADRTQVANAPTLLVYGHYDVQPPDPLDQWRTPPFQPTVVGENLFARGASDDKGQFLAVLKAVEACLAVGGLPINVKVMIEGEEEVSSPHLSAFVRDHADLLACDAVLICDHPMLDPSTPMMMVGVRGSAYLEITVRSAHTDLHSGTFGGALDNPFNVLVRLLAQVQDAQTRRIRIPGFYDAVHDGTPEERQQINSGLATDEMLRRLTGAQPAGESGFTTAERISIRPTFDIHGMPGGYVDAGKKSVIPAEARAKVSFRLVPDQDPDAVMDAFEAFLRAAAPPTVDLHIERQSKSYPVVVGIDNPYVQAAERAYRAVFGRAPVYMRGGGSLPFTHDVQQVLGVAVVMMGIGLPDDNPHAPNEKLHLPNFYRGIETIIHYLHELAAVGSHRGGR